MKPLKKYRINNPIDPPQHKLPSIEGVLKSKGTSSQSSIKQSNESKRNQLRSRIEALKNKMK